VAEERRLGETTGGEDNVDVVDVAGYFILETTCPLC